MSEAWVAGLKVAELKDELKKRGLPVAGVKAVLAQRLLEAIGKDDQVRQHATWHPALTSHALPQHLYCT